MCVCVFSCMHVTLSVCSFTLVSPILYVSMFPHNVVFSCLSFFVCLYCICIGGLVAMPSSLINAKLTRARNWKGEYVLLLASDNTHFCFYEVILYCAIH